VLQWSAVEARVLLFRLQEDEAALASAKRKGNPSTPLAAIAFRIEKKRVLTAVLHKLRG
jgi:hypothetical protein